jgi:hypothetical protein
MACLILQEIRKGMSDKSIIDLEKILKEEREKQRNIQELQDKEKTSIA